MGVGVAYCIYRMQVTKAEFTRVREELEAAEQGEASPAAAKKKKKPKKKVRARLHGTRTARALHAHCGPAARSSAALRGAASSCPRAPGEGQGQG